MSSVAPAVEPVGAARTSGMSSSNSTIGGTRLAFSKYALIS